MDEQTAQQPIQKPLYRHPVFLIVVFAVLVLIGAVALLSPRVGTNQSIGAEYQTGLSKPLIKIGLLGKFYRYPSGQSISAQPSQLVNENVFEGLIRWKDGKFSPALALTWTNPDQLTWRFNLRKDATFHTGEKFTAKDVKYTIDAAKADENSGNYSNANYISSVNVIDDYTVELKTEEPNPVLLETLTGFYILSEEQIKRDGVDNAVGTGPYKIASLEEETAVLEANKDYWGGEPKINVAVYKYRATREELQADYDRGDIDLFSTGSKKIADEYRAKGANVVTRSAGDVSVIGFDLAGATTKYVEGTNGKNPFQDSKVRHAIWDALDVTKIYAVHNLDGVVLSQLSSPELVGYNPNIPAHKQDIQKAKSLLSEAGYPNGFGFTMLVPTTGELYAKEIQRQLAEVGITMKIDLIDFSTYVDRLGAGIDPSLRDFSAFYLTQGAGFSSLSLLQELVKSTGFTNVAKYSNSELDALIAEAEKEFDPAKASEMVKKIHEKVVEELPYPLLYTNVNAYVTRDQFAMPEDLTLEPLVARDISGREKVSEN